MYLVELLDIYAKKRLRLASPHTLRLYRHSIEAFSKTLGHRATLDDFNDDALETHMYAVVERGLSVASSNKDFAQLSALWRFAHRNRLVDRWPNVRPLKEPERIPLGWLQHELERIFAAVAKLDSSICGIPESLYWDALLSTLLDSGERVGAIRKLKREHLHGQHILVPAEFRKGRTRDRLYLLLPETMEKIRTVLALSRRELIFPWPYCETYLYGKYTEILKSAGLPHSSKHKFHAIRKLVGSAVQHQGGNATVALDHANPRTTKAYLDPRITAETPTCQLVSEWRKKAIS